MSLVTANEWLVVIVAAAAFVLINIMMWTIIAARHRHSADNYTEQPAPVYPEEGTVYIQNDEIIKPQKISRKPVQPEPERQAPAERKKRDDFRLVDNIVIVHTNERL